MMNLDVSETGNEGHKSDFPKETHDKSILKLETQFPIRGYEILWETNGTLRVASSNIPENIIFDPRSSCFSMTQIYNSYSSRDISSWNQFK